MMTDKAPENVCAENIDSYLHIDLRCSFSGDTVKWNLNHCNQLILSSLRWYISRRAGFLDVWKTGSQRIKGGGRHLFQLFLSLGLCLFWEAEVTSCTASFC